MKRYSVNIQYRTGQDRMLETEGGQWVRHSDVATLTAENAALRERAEGPLLRLLHATRGEAEAARAEALYKKAEALLTADEKALHEQLAELKSQLAAAEPVAPNEAMLERVSHRLGCYPQAWDCINPLRILQAVMDECTAPPQHADVDHEEMRLLRVIARECDAAKHMLRKAGFGVSGVNIVETARLAVEEISQLRQSAEQHAARVPDGVLHLVRFLASTWVNIDKAVYEHAGAELMAKYPVIQGTKNQLDLMKVADQPFDKKLVREGVEFMLAAPTPPAQEG